MFDVSSIILKTFVGLVGGESKSLRVIYPPWTWFDLSFVETYVCPFGYGKGVTGCEFW